MLEAFTISADSRFHTLMILTENKSARASTPKNWYNKCLRISSSYFDIANSKKVVLGIINKGCSIL